jgi:hypothetical protein
MPSRRSKRRWPRPAISRRLHDRSAQGRRLLCLRRGNRAAGKPRRQARHRPRQAAAAGGRGPVRPADADQQRDHPGQRARHPGRGRRPTAISARPLARHAALPAGRQHQTRRPGRSALRPQLRELLYDFGGGSRSGRPLRAVQVGGPLGAYLPESQFDTPLDYEAFAAIGAGLGHGGIVAFDDTVDMAKQARYAMKFCAIESCGKCTPCRIGSTRGVEVIDRIRAGDAGRSNCSKTCARPWCRARPAPWAA